MASPGQPLAGFPGVAPGGASAFGAALRAEPGAEVLATGLCASGSFNGGSLAESGPRAGPYRVDPRNWGNHHRLDLVTAPQCYTNWRDRALTYLARDREDVQRLLAWAPVSARTAISRVYREYGVGMPPSINALRGGEQGDDLSLGQALQARARGDGLELHDALAADVDARLLEVLEHLDTCVEHIGTMDVLLP